MRVVIADDHGLFREGLRSLLEARGIAVAGEAETGREAVELTLRERPDVVLMDLLMPELDGLSATRLICADMPEVKVVILTASEDSEDLFEALRSGAQGYLVKNLKVDDLVGRLEGLIRGEPALTPALARKVLSEFTRATSARHQRASDTLTDREQQVLEFLVQGVVSNRELAERLSISQNTVKYHFRNILHKLHLRSRAQLVSYGLQHRLVRPQGAERTVKPS